MTSFRRDDGSLVTLGNPLAEGGEGKIYTIAGNSRLVAKIYDDSKPGQAAKLPERAAKLQMMLAKRPTSIIQQQQHISIVWPEANGRLFDTQNKCAGFLMPYVDLSKSCLL